MSTNQEVADNFVTDLENKSQSDIEDIIDKIYDSIDTNINVSLTTVGDACDAAGVSVSHEEDDIMATDGICTLKGPPPPP